MNVGMYEEVDDVDDDDDNDNEVKGGLHTKNENLASSSIIKHVIFQSIPSSR